MKRVLLPLLLACCLTLTGCASMLNRGDLLITQHNETPVVEGNNANVTVETWVTNSKMGQSIRYTFYDQEENVESVHETTGTKISTVIENVHKWHGRKDPYLYCVEAELIENGEVIDSVCTRFGCRSFQTI